jgi:hypothetical protein
MYGHVIFKSYVPYVRTFLLNNIINTYIRMVKNATIYTKKKITIRDIQRVVYMTCFLPTVNFDRQETAP